MAVIDPRDSPITRDDVYLWLEEYRKTEAQTPESLKAFIQQKLEDAGHGDTEVSTLGHEDLEDTTPLVDMILMDMESYGT